MTRKQRTLITIIIPIVLIIIIAIVLGILYMKTDFLKSNNVLFAKYVTQNFETIENIFDMKTEEDYTNLLKQSNYEYNSKISSEYIENYNTDSEVKDDIINNITLSIDGKVNNSDNIKYSDIKINNKDNELIELEYMYQNNNMYSLKFSNIFKQYISIENSNLKELAEKLGIDADSVPDQIPENTNIQEVITFTDEEINTLKNTYSNLILGNISKEKFTKQKNALITVNEKSVATDAYILKLTKEELNNIYISVLQTLEQDQIILNKIDQIENEIYKYINNEEYQGSLKEKFIENIDIEIKNIQNTNIGQDETKFTVYESNGTTVRTSIESENEQIVIDIINNTETKNIRIQKTLIGEEENKQNINISKTDTSNNYNFVVTYENINGSNTRNLGFTREILTNNNTISANTQISYYDAQNKITLNLSKDNNILANIPEIEKLDEENNVILNNYSAEELSVLLSTIQQQIQNYLNEKDSDIQNSFNSSILNLSNLNSNDITIEDTNEMSEVEKNRFNSKFEFYTSEETTYENAKKLLEVVADNLGSVEVISGTEIKLNIEKGNKDKQTVDDILNVMKDTQKYKIEIEYNEKNVVDYIIITILKNN